MKDGNAMGHARFFVIRQNYQKVEVKTFLANEAFCFICRRSKSFDYFSWWSYMEPSFVQFLIESV